MCGFGGFKSARGINERSRTPPSGSYQQLDDQESISGQQTTEKSGAHSSRLNHAQDPSHPTIALPQNLIPSHVAFPTNSGLAFVASWECDVADPGIKKDVTQASKIFEEDLNFKVRRYKIKPGETEVDLKRNIELFLRNNTTDLDRPFIFCYCGYASFKPEEASSHPLELMLQRDENSTEKIDYAIIHDFLKNKFSSSRNPGQASCRVLTILGCRYPKVLQPRNPWPIVISRRDMHHAGGQDHGKFNLLVGWNHRTDPVAALLIVMVCNAIRHLHEQRQKITASRIFNIVNGGEEHSIPPGQQRGSVISANRAFVMNARRAGNIIFGSSEFTTDDVVLQDEL